MPLYYFTFIFLYFLFCIFHFAFKWFCFVTRKFLENNEELEFYHELVLLMSFVKHRKRQNKIIFFKHCYSLLLRENKLQLCFSWFDLFMLLTFNMNLLDLNSKVFLYVWHLKQTLLSRAPIDFVLLSHTLLRMLQFQFICVEFSYIYWLFESWLLKFLLLKDKNTLFSM